MGRAIDQCQFQRPVEKPRALGRQLWLPKQRSDSGTTVLAASTIPTHPPRGHCRSQEDRDTAGGDRQAETIVAGQRADLEILRHAKEPRLESMLRQLIAEADERLEQLQQEKAKNLT